MESPLLSEASTYGLVGYDVRLTRGRSPVRSWVGVFYGSLAQMVEHWSNKPRVMGSIPIGTIFYLVDQLKTRSYRDLNPDREI